MADNTGSSTSNEGGAFKEQDMLLPIANVGRIMKQILPPNAKISKEAKETMQECASEFISFVTSEASEKCHKERRKTVTSEDICWAMNTLGFDDYASPLRRYVERYRESEEGDRTNQERASREEDRSSQRDQRRTIVDEAESSGRRFRFVTLERSMNWKINFAGHFESPQVSDLRED